MDFVVVAAVAARRRRWRECWKRGAAARLRVAAAARAASVANIEVPSFAE